MEWEYMDIQSWGNSQAVISGWSIENLIEDDKLLKMAQAEWKKNNRD